MAFCTKCGALLNENFAFCTSCGTRTAKPDEENAAQTVGSAPTQPTVAQQQEKVELTEPCVDGTKVFGINNGETVPLSRIETEEKAETPATAAKAEKLKTIIPPDAIPFPVGMCSQYAKSMENESGNTQQRVGDTNDKTRVAPTMPNYDRPPVNTYEQTYGVPSGPDPKLPLSTEPYRGKPDKKGEYGVVGTLYYFLMTLLYCIPLVGLIMSIVLSFGGTINQNKRSFARAVLIYKFIGILFIFAVLLMCIMFKEVIFDAFNEVFGWQIVSWGDLIELFE